MPALKGSKNALGNKGGTGRPTLYEARFARMAKEMTLLGATDAELARLFEVDEATVNAWKRKHQKFSQALKDGKQLADARVAGSLYSRATGHKHRAVKIFQHEGRSFEHEYTEQYPPETTACIFWLKNRQPDRWRDKPVKEEGDDRLDEVIDLIKRGPAQAEESVSALSGEPESVTAAASQPDSEQSISQ